MAAFTLMVIFAAASFATQTAHAQGQPDRDREVKVTGCIAQSPRTGSLTDDTATGNVPTPNTAGVEANSSEPVNAYILLDATPVVDGGGRREAGERTSYSLQGLASEVANHKGHRVEIAGQLLPRDSTVSGPKSPASAIQRIAVHSIKLLSAQCGSPQER